MSKNVIPASIAAETTEAVVCSSMRHPKLLHPNPTTETSSDLMRRVSILSSFRSQCYPEYLNPLVSPRLALLCLAASLAAAQTPAEPTGKPSALLNAMSQELNRNFTRSQRESRSAAVLPEL